MAVESPRGSHGDVISAGTNTQQLTFGPSETEVPTGGITMPTISESDIPDSTREQEASETAGTTSSISTSARASDLAPSLIMPQFYW